MKKSMLFFTFMVLIGVALILSGCDALDEAEPIDEPGVVEPIEEENLGENGEDQEGQEGQLVIDESEWPKEKVAIIMIEGMEEEMQLERFHHEGIPFITYIPQDMIGESVSSGEADSVWFYANFGGVKNEDAFIRFTFYPADQDEINLDTLRERYGWSLIESEITERRYNWSIDEAHIENEEVVGYVAIGQYEDQYFTMSYQYPLEFGDGFSPRIQMIIDEFYFLEQQTFLNELH